MIASVQKPPWSVEAEVAVLGAALMSEHSLAVAAGIIGPDDFFREAHRRIFRAALDLWRSGTAADVATIAARLRASGELDGVGGMGYIADLIDAAPTAQLVPDHARLILETATLRRIADAAQQTARDALSGQTGSAEVLADTHARLLSVRRETGEGYVRVGRDMLAVMAEIETESESGKRGVTAGIPTLDRMTNGMHAGDLTVLAARPSMGKTALGLQAALHAALAGHPVLVASLEMSRHQLIKRSLAGLARMSIEYAIRTPERSAKLGEAANLLSRLPVLIDDRPGDKMDALRAGVLRAASKNPPALLMIDYLQLLEGVGENRTQQVGSISRGLKLLARELACPVLVLSQLSRKVEDRAPPRPVLSDLRDSGAIEQDADVVLLLWRPEYYFDEKTKADVREKWQGRGELIVAKQRNGPTGKIQMLWDAPTTTFTEEDIPHH